MTTPEGRHEPAGPPSSDGREILAKRHDALLVDLDGVVYRGDHPIPAAPGTFTELASLGVPVVFLTNNSSRPTRFVAQKLRSMGVPARPDDILSSAQATARLLQREGAGGSTAFVIGERGIREALEAVGVVLVDGSAGRADLVVVGWDRSADYDKLKTASLFVERGARLIATNGDASYPAPDGMWPGAGALLAAVVTATGATPLVVGKPARPMFEAAAEAAGASRPLVVGDRLDTDVAGAVAMGWDSLLVMSGAARPADLVFADALPNHVAADVGALLDRRPVARFRPLRRGEVAKVESLLGVSGLSDRGVAERFAGTLVSVAGAAGSDEPIDATACVEGAGKSAILRSVAVRPDLRGFGLGMLAVASAAREARRRESISLWLFTENAAPFFERMGFRMVERRTLPGEVRDSRHAAEECAASAVPMGLSLASG